MSVRKVIDNNNIKDDIERVYNLGDTEMIVKSVITDIYYLAIMKSRNKYLSSLKRNYVMSKTFTFFEDLLHLKELNWESGRNNNDNEVIISQAERPKIDNWASNKTKIIEDEFILIIPKVEIHRNSVFKKTFKAIESVKDKFTNGKNRKGSILTNEFNLKINLNVPSNKSLLNSKEMKVYVEKKSMVEKPTNKNNESSNDQISLVDEYVKKRPLPDEQEIIEAKALRTYFKEREIEAARKKNMDRENENKHIEEEKNRKKISDNVKVHSYDSSGRFLIIKPIDPDKLTTFAKPNFSYGEKKSKVSKQPIKKTESSSNVNTLLTTQLTTENNVNKRILIIQSEPKENNITPVLYFQPDPIDTIAPSEGVNLLSGGKKVLGGSYQAENRMNLKDFQNILTQINPKKHNILNDVKDGNMQSITGKYIAITEYPQEEAYTNKLSNVYNVLTDCNDDFLEKSVKIENLKSKIPKEVTKKKNDKLPNKNINFIKTSKDFNYQNLYKIDSSEVYDQLDIKSPDSFQINYQKIKMNLPVNNHGQIKQELGQMKKYPRDRLPKEILAITGKGIIIPHVKHFSMDNKITKTILKTKI